MKREMSSRAKLYVSLALTALVSLAATGSAYAQSVQVSTDVKSPPQEIEELSSLTDAELSLADAVQLTLVHSPGVLLAKQDVALAQAQLQETSGFFDATFITSPLVAYEQNELSPSLRGREIDKREQLRIIAETFETLSAQLKETLDEMSVKPPRCPTGFVFDDGIILDGLDESETSQIGLTNSTSFVNFDIESGVGDFDSVCIPPTDFTFPDLTLEFLEEINRIENLGLENFIADFTQFPQEELNLAYEIADAVATRSRIGLIRLGDLPIDNVTKSISISFSYLRAFRNGMTMKADANFDSSQTNFKDKNLDPTFGGFGQQDRFPSFVSVALEMPLRKGRGRISAAAPERAAERNLVASEDLLRHALSEEAFRAVLGYIDLMAAQQTAQYLLESSERQDRFVDLTNQLIEADELPGMELGRARARAAQVKSALVNARLGTLSARLNLAQTLGIDVADLSAAPTAMDQLSESLVAVPDVDRLVQSALNQRRDSRALSELKEASRLLAEAAKWDSRYRIDLSINAGMSSLYESPFFRFLPDELEPEDVPEFDPNHFYSPGGYWRMIRGNWTPFFKVGITFEVPFQNNRAKGQLVQSQSSLRTSQIKHADLRRVIQDNVVQVYDALMHAGRTVELRQEAIGNYEQTLDAARALFELGDLSLIDTLITEEDLTREKLQLVNDLKVYFSTLTRLKFEIGDLVHFENEGLPFELVEFEAGELVAP